VWVRWDGRVVRIFNDRLELIATHVQHEPGRLSTQSKHIAPEKISGIEWGATWLLGQAQCIGPQAAQWAEAVVRERGVEGMRVLQGLLALAGKHRSDCLEKACGTALSYGSYRFKTIRTLLERAAPGQESLALLEEHPIIRALSEYARITPDAFSKEARP
jgi:hypothetical protein